MRIEILATLIMPDHSNDDWEYCTMQIIETNINSDCSVDEDFEALKSSQKKSKTHDLSVSFPDFPSIWYLYTPTCSTSNISSSNAYQCKLAKKSHSCTFQNGIINDQGTLLLAMAHQLCKLSELNSLIESKKSSHCDEHVPTSSSANENILSPFPLKNEDELMLIESKLVSEDLSFTSILVTSFVFASEGKSIQKLERPEKQKKLHTLNIFQVIIDLEKTLTIYKSESIMQSARSFPKKLVIEAVLKKKKDDSTGNITANLNKMSPPQLRNSDTQKHVDQAAI
ncbi:hypothetical protein ACI65C_013611 [Semiaphis heraclei]